MDVLTPLSGVFGCIFLVFAFGFLCYGLGKPRRSFWRRWFLVAASIEALCVLMLLAHLVFVGFKP